MSDRITEGLKKVLYTGVGAAALAVDLTGKAVNTLAKKGEQTIEKGRIMNEELKRKRAKAEVDIKEMAQALSQMNREEIEAIRLRMSEIEKSMGSVSEEVKINASAIISSLEKMGRDELEVLKAKIEEIKASWNDSCDDDDKGPSV